MRNLIARCNPPIRVLQLALSDIRTKDFRYLFDRAVTFEDLYIGGLDMLDNVINLLRPFHRLDDRQDSPWHIRLPRLQKLELYGCRRSSGDAVVDAFTARFNNAAAYATLRELDYGLQPVCIYGPRSVYRSPCASTLEVPVGTRLQYEATFLPDRSVTTSPTVYLRP